MPEIRFWVYGRNREMNLGLPVVEQYVSYQIFGAFDDIISRFRSDFGCSIR